MRKVHQAKDDHSLSVLQEQDQKDAGQQQVKKEDSACEDIIIMKQYCRNDCGRHVRNPRSKSWLIDGICPACRDKMAYSHPRVTQVFDGEISVVHYNPVDLYWHTLALREMQINDNR